MEKLRTSQIQPTFLFVINREKCLECNKLFGQICFCLQLLTIHYIHVCYRQHII